MLMLERTEALDQLIVDFAREVGAGAVEHAEPSGVAGESRGAIPIAGVRVGHWTGRGTGVTVRARARRHGRRRARCAAARRRRRELALLEPDRTVDARRRGRVRRRLRVRARRPPTA